MTQSTSRPRACTRVSGSHEGRGDRDRRAAGGASRSRSSPARRTNAEPTLPRPSRPIRNVPTAARVRVRRNERFKSRRHRRVDLRGAGGMCVGCRRHTRAFTRVVRSAISQCSAACRQHSCCCTARIRGSEIFRSSLIGPTEVLSLPGYRAGSSTLAVRSEGPPGCCGFVGPVPSATLDKRLRQAQT